MLNMQNVKDIEITEGDVRTIHDKDNKLIWGRLAYDTKYAGDTEQQTYTGKNILPILDGTITYEGITATMENGILTINGTPSNGMNIKLSNGFEANPSSQIDSNWLNETITNDLSNKVLSITLLSGTAPSVASAFRIFNNTIAYVKQSYPNNSATLTFSSGDAASCFTIFIGAGRTFDNAKYEIQLETGSTATAFEPYVGGVPSPNPDYPQDVNVVTGTQTVTISNGVNSEDYTISLGTTELCKIDTYQDYIYKSGDEWYVHKATNKYIFTGSETIGKAGNTSNNSYYYASSQNPNYGFSDIDRTHMTSGSGSTAVIPIYAKYFGENSSNNIVSTDSIGIGFNLSGASGIDCRIGVGLSSSINTAALLKTWLTNNTLSVYYPLATPTDIQITDTTLIGQLDAIHQFLTRYGYNSNVTGNLPIIINQTTL